MKNILLTGSLRSPPPIRAAPDFSTGKRVTRFSGCFAPLRIVFPCHPLFRGQNKTPRNTLFISNYTVSTGYSAPACGGKVVAPATKRGMHFQRPQGGCEGFIQTGAFYQFIGALQQPSRQRRVKLKPLKNLRPIGPSTFKPDRACP